MNQIFYQKKIGNPWKMEQGLLKCQKRLEHLLKTYKQSKDNSAKTSKGISKQRKHLLSQKHKSRQCQNNIQTKKQAQFMRQASLPHLSPLSNDTTQIYRRINPIKSGQLQENSMYYSKTTNAYSHNKKFDFNKSLKGFCQIRGNLKKKSHMRTPSNFKKSPCKQSCYPDHTLTHYYKQNAKNISQQLRLKFQLLPVLQLPQVVFGIEIRTQLGKMIASSKLFELGQLRKDTFVFRIRKTKFQTLTVVLVRYRNNTPNAQGMFNVSRGRHVATELKSTSGNILSHILCYTSWGQAQTEEQDFKIIIGQGILSQFEKQNICINENGIHESESQVSRILTQKEQEEDSRMVEII